MRKGARRKPCLILIMGVAGSGKSTLAREILRRIRAVYLNNNHIADAFFPHTRNGRAYEKLRPGFYKALYTITTENLKLGNSVLLDVPHIKEVQTNQWRGFMKRLATRAQARLVVIRCLCSEETLLRRLQSRADARDHRKLEHWKEFLSVQPIRASIPFRHLDIDTEKQLQTNLRTALRHIQTQLDRDKRNG